MGWRAHFGALLTSALYAQLEEERKLEIHLGCEPCFSSYLGCCLRQRRFLLAGSTSLIAEQTIHFSPLPVSTSVSQRYGIKVPLQNQAEKSLSLWVQVSVLIDRPCSYHHNSALFHAHIHTLVLEPHSQGAASVKTICAGILTCCVISYLHLTDIHQQLELAQETSCTGVARIYTSLFAYSSV